MNKITSVESGHFSMILAATLICLALAVDSAAGGQSNVAEVNASSRSPLTASATDQQSLADRINELQSKVAKLEAVLKRQHAGEMRSDGQNGRMGGRANRATSKGSTMGMGSMAGQGMPAIRPQEMMRGNQKTMPGKTMGGKGMSGMAMMGQMKGMGQMTVPSALSGFAGASHIYHIGATGFFLDHPQHITLTKDQQIKLNQIKEKTLLGQATFDRWISQAEQELWVLTGSDAPDAASIESKIRELEKLNGDKRIAYIRAVGEAARVLTDEQRKILVGTMLPTNDALTPSDN